MVIPSMLVEITLRSVGPQMILKIVGPQIIKGVCLATNYTGVVGSLSQSTVSMHTYILINNTMDKR